MPPHSASTSRNIIPSSGAIHTTNDEIRRTLYYSSLIIINNGSSSKSRRKVHLGDIVAVSKSNQNQSAHEVIESWKPNHYTKKSPEWKIGLVIALRKVITRGANGGIQFECHVQWLEKSLDLGKDDMKSSNLKSIYRPYNTNSNTGSQLPHVLINCPGDYGVVSMIPTDKDYCIILPVNITMKTNRDFMRNGVKEAEESKHELQFCCTKTRRQERILNEREPDAWVLLNRPGANENEGVDTSAQLVNKVPGPLQQAWKGWLQLQNTSDETFQESISRLGDALMRGWNQSRRERLQKFILKREEQRREDEKKMEEDSIKSDNKRAKSKKMEAGSMISKALKGSKLGSNELDTSTKRKSSTMDNDKTTATENAGIKRKKKELRFSADTKQPSTESIPTSKSLVKKSQINKRLRGDSTSSSLSSRHEQKVSNTSIPTKTETKRKRGRPPKAQSANDDEAASTTTRDTHSTDTTLPTRGAGRKRKLKEVASQKKDSIDCNDNGTETTANTSTTSSNLSTVSPSSVSKALSKWSVDSTFTKNTGAFHTTKQKRCYKELRMSIPLADPAIRCLLDEDEVGILDQYHSNNLDMNYQHFHIKIGSVVALHYKDSVSTTNSWSPFRVPWGVAQVTNIFTQNNVDDGDESWTVTIKWFYRYPELGSGRRTKTLESMNKIDGLVETFETCDCSVEELLPAYIDLTSETEEFAKCPRQEQGKNGFPIVRMICQHIEHSRGKIRKLYDWTYNHRAFLQSLPSTPEGSLPGPFKRSFEKMSALQKKRFKTWFEETSDDDKTKDSGCQKEVMIPSLDIVPETAGVSYKHRGIEYFDSICLNVQKKHLNTSLRAKSSNRWTIAVGHIVAVHSQHDNLGKSRSDPRRWYPYLKQWCPAQVVALYKKECGTWMMEIRWFDRFKEVLQQHKENISHLNKPYVVFETEVYEHLPVAAALSGRVILTSVENDQGWDAIASDSTGLPLIPRLCTHMCFDEEIDTCMDWTNYDSNLSQVPPGLSRGLLLSPRNRQKKTLISILSRYYMRVIKNRGNDPDHDFLQKWNTGGGNMVKANKQVCDRFTASATKIEPRRHLLTTSLQKGFRDFFKSVTIRSPTKYLVSPTIEMKRKKNNCFDCVVGDIVCFFDKNASTPENYTSTHYLKHPWFPFQIPWSYGQILTIYKEGGKESDGKTKIEMRRFYKMSELSDKAREFLPVSFEANCEEIFESNDVMEPLDASCLLGIANVLLGNHTSSGCDNIDSERRKTIASCRCRFFYLRTFQSLQPIYWSSLYPRGWHQGLQQRGYQQSKFVTKYETLRQAVVKSADKGPILDLLTSCEKHQEEGFCVRLGNSIKSSLSQRWYYADVALHPQWSLFAASESLSLADCSERKPWKVEVGDVVAVKEPDNPQDFTPFPFSVPWFPGQILAIFDESDGNDLTSVQFEIRRLNFEASTSTSRRTLTACDPSKVVTVPSLSLLAPLIVYFSDSKFETDLKLNQAHLPLSEFMGTESLRADIRNALALSKLYTMDDRKKLVEFVRNDLRKDSPRKTSSLNEEDPNKGSPNTQEHQYISRPFRIDNFKMRAFYSELSMLPECKIFRGGLYESYPSSETVTLGDTVRVRFKGAKRFPFDCNWGTGEVVAIFEEFQSKDELDRVHELDPTKRRKNNLKVEIRWFYERQDISMSVPASENGSDLTEVFETDLCQVMDASTAILGHVKLVENAADVKNDGTDYFLCTRFWSTKRRTLIPCSGLDGRIKRGMTYSTLGSADDINEKPVFSNTAVSSNRKLGNWKDAMSNLICKLTLKDASKNAYASGEALVGREKELSQLLSFLRGAFFDDRRSMGYKSSMFLAGPPGVGKTASVRAAIAKLRQEQKAGTIPKFRFISLNGIEVRHPFDIYIRFYESLTGKNHYGPHERACEWLEAYFTSMSPEHNLPDNCTTIVLLDEIDYLITTKQSVLYNLFDWPKRAAELSHGRRLIVVGISNTLNLVDQLMPSVQSRVGTERCVFKAYSLQDTTSILKSKIKEGAPDFNFFEDDAILFAAKKTAALSGDIRKAFQLCRSAAQLVTQRYEQKQEKEGKLALSHPTIRIGDIQKASLESFNMAMVTAVSFAASYEALLLVSLAALCRATGREIGGFDIKDILTKMEALANAAGDSQYIPAPSFDETIRLLTRLGEMNLVELQTLKSSSMTFRQSSGGSGGAWPMTSLAIDELTLLKGLKNTPHHELAQKNLPFSF